MNIIFYLKEHSHILQFRYFNSFIWQREPKNFLKNISRGNTLYHKINLFNLGGQMYIFDICANFTINTKKIKLVEIF